MVAVLALVTVTSLVFNAVTTPPPTLPAPSGADLVVGGTRVHYQRWGTHGPPLVLVHGFAESSVAWGPAAELLARDHVVYAVDLAGYGYTDFTGRYALGDQVDLVDAFVRRLGLDHPVLIGHSMGAAVVGGVALAHPSDIGGIVFVDGDGLPFANGSTGSGSAGGGSGPARWILRSPYGISAYRLLTRSARLDDRLIRSNCGATCLGLTPELVEAWMRPMRQGAAEAALPAMAANGVLSLSPDQLRAIRVPRAIIWGELDLRSGGSLDDARHDLGEPPTMVIPGAGHLAMLGDPVTFAADVEQVTAGMSAAH
ncbi:Pimeloyl-ACP methyl ester carboxylesterase [Raineyella antarctica]|uniref:Pimeloyl-ACP methyl ester carboxylesterase n=1 Tax=Raineyella antarctica TaxID=1577474 RepID=A0A1G6H7S5_9ACTN|nr:Pimeloyl-ACP methyl ester carboxylesterase [Raineyella antarctica]